MRGYFSLARIQNRASDTILTFFPVTGCVNSISAACR